MYMSKKWKKEKKGTNDTKATSRSHLSYSSLNCIKKNVTIKNFQFLLSDLTECQLNEDANVKKIYIV